MRLFLSSESTNRQFCHHFVAAVEMRGFNIWCGFNDEAEKLKGYWPRVKYHIANADIIIGVYKTPPSHHVMHEISSIQTGAKVVFVTLEDIKYNDKANLHSLSDAIFDLTDWNGGSKHEDFENFVKFLETFEREHAPIRDVLANKRAETAEFVHEIRNIIHHRLQNLEASKPNEKTKLIAWNKSKIELSKLVNSLDNLGNEIGDPIENISEDNIAGTSKALKEIQRQLSGWYDKNAADVLDSMIRTGVIGLIAGIGALFGQPMLALAVGGTMFGGEKITKGLAAALKPNGVASS